MWSDLVAKVNASKLKAFGVPITYTLNPGEVDIPATAIRHDRLKDLTLEYPQREEIELDPGSLPGYPATGDWVTLASGVVYTVLNVRRPDPYSLVVIALDQRRGQILP